VPVIIPAKIDCQDAFFEKSENNTAGPKAAPSQGLKIAAIISIKTFSLSAIFGNIGTAIIPTSTAALKEIATQITAIFQAGATFLIVSIPIKRASICGCPK